MDKIINAKLEDLTPVVASAPLDQLTPVSSTPAVGTPEFAANLQKARTQANLVQPGEMQRADANAADPLSQAQLPGESWGGATTRQVIGSGVNAVKGAAGLFAPPRPGEVGDTGSLAVKRALIDPSVDQWQNGATKLGALPIVGPMAAHMGSAAGSGNYGGAAVDALSLAPIVGGAAGAIVKGGTALKNAAMGTASTTEVPAALLRTGLKKPVGMPERVFQKATSGFPDVAKTALDEGVDVKSAIDAEAVGNITKGRLYRQYKALEAPVQSVEVDPSVMQDSVLATARNRVHLTDAQMAKAQQFAQDAGAIDTVGKLSDYVEGLHQQLNKLYDKSGQAMHDAESAFETDLLHSESIAAEHTLHEALNKYAGPDAVAARQRYGQAAQLQGMFERAASVERNAQALEASTPPIANTAKIFKPLKSAKKAVENAFTSPATLIEKAFDVYQPNEWPASVTPNRVGPYPELGAGSSGGPNGAIPMGSADRMPSNTGYATPAPLMQNQRALPSAGAQVPLGSAPIMPDNTGFATPFPLMQNQRALPSAGIQEPLPPSPMAPGNTGFGMPPDLMRSQGALPSAGAQIPQPPADIMPGTTGTPQAAQRLAPLGRQLPPGPPGQGRMTVLQPGQSNPGMPSSTGATTGTGPFPTPELGAPPQASFPAAHPSPIRPEAFLMLEDLPREALDSVLNGKGMDLNRLQEIKRHMEIGEMRKDFPRLWQALDASIGKRTAKPMLH